MNKNEAIENNNLSDDKDLNIQSDFASEFEDEPGVLVLEGEYQKEEAPAEEKGRPTYMPRFTEASERYRRKGDAKIRERLGIKSVPEKVVEETIDEIKLDPTAEFETDFSGTEDAKAPDNVAVDESDESINVLKFKSPEDELEEEAAREREEIKKLLGTDSKPESTPEPEPEIEEVEEEPAEEELVVEEEKVEYDIPDPEDSEFEVFDFEDNKSSANEPAVTVAEPSDNSKKTKAKGIDREFNNPIQRDSIKDRFLDSLISIRIRMVAAIVFAVGLFALELLSGIGVIPFDLFGTKTHYLIGLVDFLLGACIFVMASPELIKAVKNLFGKKLVPELIPVPSFIVFGLYTLTLILSGATSYALLGLIFAVITIPVLGAALDRTKAGFIAFKMIAQPDDKQVIDIQNTRELVVENKALDGVVDEYKSKLTRTFTTSFVSDFFKNSEDRPVSAKHFGLVFGVPFGVALVAGVAAFFLAGNNIVTAAAVLALVVMLGCPAFSIFASKASFFYSQRAALLTDSTVIGEEAYHSFSSADVFAFDDTDIFGPDDVNLKRFMLYGDRDNMDKVMRQMCALFASVGGPLDYMFSGIIDNRVRHKTASNVIIEDDGICGDVAGHKIYAGSEDYMRRNGIAIPQAAIGRDNPSSLDTTKIMYAAEDGEVNAKFYIRYSFSEEFTSTVPSLRDAGIIPLIYTRDPNVSNELLTTLSAGSDTTMRVVKLYDTVTEESHQNRTSARMITYGDRLDAAEMVVLAKKYHKFSLYLNFVELCSSFIGICLAIGLSLIAFMAGGAITIPMAALWHVIIYTVIRMLSKAVFLNESKKKNVD